MFHNKKVSVILPCYNEEEPLQYFLKELTSINILDEIIVVDNNSTDNSKKIIQSFNVIYKFESIKGYGSAIKSGLNMATGDLLVTIEPDCSFDAKDIIKLLEYTDKFECVFGTRTNKNFIQKKSKMQFYLRWGNIIVAKFLQYIFFSSKLTDVGCTLKIIDIKSFEKISKKLKVNKSYFQPELMIRLIKDKRKIIEIPVTYKERKGNSKITSNISSSILLGFKMAILIFLMRLNIF